MPSTKARATSSARRFAAKAAAACGIAAATAWSAILCSAMAGSLEISKAWTPPVSETGGNSPLLMTITNHGDDADSLLRARCPVANFIEKHTVDRGEGAPAMRAISSIAVPPKQTVTLNGSGLHLMLLQTRQVLVAGERFVCSVSFAKAGPLDVEVVVAFQAPGS